MFERFTERARQVIVLAQEEARALRHNYIGTEHLLLGLMREADGVAARVLGSLEVSLDEVRGDVGRIVGEGDSESQGQLPFTPRAKKVLELALREALSLGHNYIGTEHVLLGLVRESEGVAARILGDLDVVVSNLADRAVILRNDTQGGHWLTVELMDRQGRRNPDGSELWATVGDKQLHTVVHPRTTYLSQSDRRPHFGLAGATKIDKLLIRWPNGKEQILEDVTSDQFLTVREQQADGAD